MLGLILGDRVLFLYRIYNVKKEGRALLVYASFLSVSRIKSAQSLLSFRPHPVMFLMCFMLSMNFPLHKETIAGYKKSVVRSSVAKGKYFC